MQKLVFLFIFLKIKIRSDALETRKIGKRCIARIDTLSRFVHYLIANGNMITSFAFVS